MSSVESPHVVDAIPKVDLHLHQERRARSQQLSSLRGDDNADEWEAWRRELTALPPGMPRLERLWRDADPSGVRDGADERRDRFRVIIEEAAAAGAVLVEIRVGNESLLWPDLMDSLRSAERQARHRFPDVCAEIVGVVKMWAPQSELERVVRACVRLRSEGLSGVDFLYQPYAEEADWHEIHVVADRLASSGLGITVHAGEFSEANIESAIATPGVSRLGHVVHASSGRLRELVISSGVTVECCLTSNVLLGAVPSSAEHPIRSWYGDGVPVVLGTDNPLVMGTSIGREYRIASELGFTEVELRSLTADAIRYSFADDITKTRLLRRLVGTDGSSEASAR